MMGSGFMKRVLAAAVSCSLILSFGCSQSYSKRLDSTLNRLKYLQRLDQFLKPAEAGKLQEMGIYFRPPLGLEQAQQPGLNAPPGHYDVVATFLDLGTAAAGANAKEKVAPAAPLRLHLLARINRKAPASKKKGETPEEPVTPRGKFDDDVRALLASDLGGQDALNNPLQSIKIKSNDYKRLIFTASNGDTIKAYFFKAGEYDLALVWDIPAEQAKSAAASTGAELAMESLAVGPRAVTAFQGGDADEDIVQSAGDAGAAGGPGQPF